MLDETGQLIKVLLAMESTKSAQGGDETEWFLRSIPSKLIFSSL